MEKEAVDWMRVEALVDEMVEQQQGSLLKLGRRIVPNLTSEDAMQPNDYSDLESHPEFRYEEGILAGYQSVQIALRSLRREEDGAFLD